MIYLDHAATTMPKPPQVIEAVTRAMTTFGNASRGGHSAALDASRAVYRTRGQLSDFFHGYGASSVIFTANATESLNLTLNGLFEDGDHVITTDWEHNSVLRPLYRLQDAGKLSVSFLPAHTNGRLLMEKLPTLLQTNTRAIVCTHASNVTGNVIDLQAIGAFARAHGLLLVVDASQTAGILPIDQQAMGIDVLCFTGHKGLLGPQGTGGVLIRPGVSIRPWKTGGTGVMSFSKTQPDKLPERLEAGTLNIHGIAGLSAGLELLQEIGLSEVMRREEALVHRFCEGVRGCENVRLYGDFSAPRVAVVSLNIGSLDSGEVSDWLAEEYGIATRPGAHCAPRMHEALGTQKQGTVRFSFSISNTMEEIDEVVRAVREIAREEAL